MQLSTKERKEALVAGLSGTTKFEISAVTAVPIAFLLTYRVVSQHQAAARSSLPVAEWLLLVTTQLSCQLDVISAPLLLLLNAAFVIVLLLLRRGERPRSLFTRCTPLCGDLRDALTLFRATLLVLTVTAILAVDFQAFPRRLAKTETYGTGLMDVGVGCFVLASALPTGFSTFRKTARRTSTALMRAGVLAVLGVVRALSTWAVDYQVHVGEYGAHWNFFLTLAAVQGAAAALTSSIRSAAAAGVCGASVLLLHQLALSCGGLSPYINSAGPRPHWVAANKEGLLSLPGYLALHWLGTALGHWLSTLPGRQQQAQQAQQQSAGGQMTRQWQWQCGGHGLAGGAPQTGPRRLQGAEERKGEGEGVAVGQPSDPHGEGVQDEAGRGLGQDGASLQSSYNNNGEATEKAEGQAGGTARVAAPWGVLMRVAAVDVALWVACLAAERWVEGVSRRSCNLAYVLWVLALSLQGTGLYLLVGCVAPGPVPTLLQGLNRAMLPVFLVANLLTGAVNLTVDTLSVGRGGAACILLSYLGGLCALAGVAGRGR